MKTVLRGVSRIFETGGPISLGSLKKKGHQNFKRGGSNGLIGGGGVQYISLPRTTNLAYLDANGVKLKLPSPGIEYKYIGKE